MVVNESNPLPMLALVTGETVQSRVPQVLLIELECDIEAAVTWLKTSFYVSTFPVTPSSPSSSELVPDFADKSSFKEETLSHSLPCWMIWRPSPEEVVLQD